MTDRVPAQLPAGGRCKIAFIGEAPGVEEVAQGRPFIGRSGKLFNKLLRQADIERDECLVTNAFDFELPGNQIKPLCVTQKEADEEAEWPQLQVPIERGAYVPATIAVPQLQRLRSELQECGPNVLVALGGSAAWAVLGVPTYGKMKKMRGAVYDHGPMGRKVLVTYHPAYVVRNYAALPIVLADFNKARREGEYPEIRRPTVDVAIPKTPEEVIEFLNQLGKLTAVDIETLQGQIDCIGFADCFERAMCVPIFNPETMASYWPTLDDEYRVVCAIRDYLADPRKRKVFQNGGYDVQWLFEKWRMVVRGWTDDTRLLHHSLWPESPKDLGTIASLHLNMPGWKLAGAGRAGTKKED